MSHRRMTTCPNCGWAVYGNRVTFYNDYIEIDCPRCGVQDKDLPTSKNEMSRIKDWQKEADNA